jgi:hypothetical protein
LRLHILRELEVFTRMNTKTQHTFRHVHDGVLANSERNKEVLKHFSASAVVPLLIVCLSISIKSIVIYQNRISRSNVKSKCQDQLSNVKINYQRQVQLFNCQVSISTVKCQDQLSMSTSSVKSSEVTCRNGTMSRVQCHSNPSHFCLVVTLAGTRNGTGSSGGSLTPW